MMHAEQLEERPNIALQQVELNEPVLEQDWHECQRLCAALRFPDFRCRHEGL
jgi:hypothetical protein